MSQAFDHHAPVLLTASAANSLAGSFGAEHIERWLGRTQSLTLSVLDNAVRLGVPALTTNPFVVGAGFHVGGIAIMGWNVIVVSLRQRISPDRLLSRVNSGFRLFAWGDAAWRRRRRTAGRVHRAPSDIRGDGRPGADLGW